MLFDQLICFRGKASGKEQYVNKPLWFSVFGLGTYAVLFFGLEIETGNRVMEIILSGTLISAVIGILMKGLSAKRFGFRLMSKGLIASAVLFGLLSSGTLETEAAKLLAVLLGIACLSVVIPPLSLLHAGSRDWFFKKPPEPPKKKKKKKKGGE